MTLSLSLSLSPLTVNRTRWPKLTLGFVMFLHYVLFLIELNILVWLNIDRQCNFWV